MPVGITNPPSGSAEPDRLSPARSGGNTEPKLIANIGSTSCDSTQRPNQPLLKRATGAPLCQIAIDVK